ncbi:MAG: TolC family protein, partial [Bacteroidota bacterium]
MKTINKIGFVTIGWLGLSVMALANTGQPDLLKKLTLDECLQLGYKSHASMIAAEHRITIAQKSVQEKLGSYFPSLNYSISRAEQGIEQPVFNPYINQYQTQTSESDTYTEGISLTQYLYAGGAIKSGYQIALLNLESAMEDKRRAEQELAYNIKSAFYDLWLKQQNYRTALAFQENMAKHYQIINRMYQLGRSNKLDLSQARVLWEEQKVAALTAGNQVAEARLTLAALIGIDKFQEFEVELDIEKLDLSEGYEADPRAIAEEAYVKRPDLRRMKQAIAIAEYQVVQAKAGLLPKVTLSYDYQLNDEELFGDNTKQWSLKLNLSGMAFDGFATKNRIAAARENLKLLQHQETTQRDQAMVEIIQTLRNLKETKHLIDVNRLNIDLASENVNLTEIQFNNGKATTSDFKDAQMSLLQAYDGYHGQVI